MRSPSKQRSLSKIHSITHAAWRLRQVIRINLSISPLTNLNGVGKARAATLAASGIETIYDLLRRYPHRYLDYTSPVSVYDAVCGENALLRLQVLRKSPPQYIRKSLIICKAVVTDGKSDMTLTMFNNVYAFNALQIGVWYRMYGKIQGTQRHKEIHSQRYIPETQETKIEPIYTLPKGISAKTFQNLLRQALQILHENPLPDWTTPTLREEWQLIPLSEAFAQIHFPTTLAHAARARDRLVFDELLIMQLSLFSSRAGIRMGTAIPLDIPVNWAPFLKSLPFQLTAGQQKALKEIVSDLRRRIPMNRLLQGDVGSGKTAVAAGACYYAICAGVQCAFMAPTEILSLQHYETLTNLLSPLGISVAILTGSTKPAEKDRCYEGLSNGSISLVVGTHAIFQKGVTFSKLGLVITDEQHRFGVAQRAQLAGKGGAPHKLIMSATPIPRTLALTFYGDLDISTLREMPKGRLTVKTYAINGRIRARAYSFVKEQLKAGHQAYIVCPMIDENEDLAVQAAATYADKVQHEVFLGYHVGLLHGRMKPAERDAVMATFRAGEIDVLVCTTVIEVGVDVPNVTVMMVENAERFGLSQLHQLRGRVGRGSAQSYCILLTDHPTEECLDRMRTMCRFSDGFSIAEADLAIRGPGDFFGARQHGLPPLQFPMTQNIAFLERVQKTAREILQHDPDLANSQHALLRTAVTQMLQKLGENWDN